jgi:predicted DNA-binding protein (MmcQ/YjbR family)
MLDAKSLTTLKRRALRHADVEEGVACPGTSLERWTAVTKKKAFMFLGPTDLRLKLGPSLAEAQGLAVADPAQYSAGAQGWVTVKFTGKPALALLKRWIDESYEVIAAKTPPKKKAPQKKK